MTYETPELLTLGQAEEIVLGGDIGGVEDADNSSKPFAEVFGLDE